MRWPVAAAESEPMVHVGLLHGPDGGPPSAPSLAQRRRRKRKLESRELALNIVPLVDVVFLLMIFFIIAGTFESWEGSLASKMLRAGKGEGKVALPISPVIIRVGLLSDQPMGYSLVVDGVTRQPENFLALADVLRGVLQQPGFGADTPVVVVADGKVKWDHVVNAWNAALRAGFVRVAFGDQ